MFSAHRRRAELWLERFPIRVRLAASVAAVVFVILVAFAVVMGQINANRQWAEFHNRVEAQAQSVASSLTITNVNPVTGQVTFGVPPSQYANVTNAQIRIYTLDGRLIQKTGPYLGSPFNPTNDLNGYWSATVTEALDHDGTIRVVYGLPTATTGAEIAGLRFILLLGALVGTALAFGAGWLVARRAMTPIAELTAAAGEIERTGDPSRTLPDPVAEDEVAELSRTLSGMLGSLNHARQQTEAMLERQREFVADASHELRTPLTSVLANLELLADSLQGPDRDAAASALRSTQRMRRLVGDLLLLARADGGHEPLRDRLDLADVVIEAASELEPASQEHTIELDVQPTPLVGSRDDLQRVAINLIENALHHTPAGTRVTASTRALPDGTAELVVADDGPGIPEAARATLFDRFVRGAGDRGGSFGLGLAIVAAVTRAHHGSVTVDESPHGGARFTVRLPGVESAPALPPAQLERATSEPSVS